MKEKYSSIPIQFMYNGDFYSFLKYTNIDKNCIYILTENVYMKRQIAC